MKMIRDTGAARQRFFRDAHPRPPHLGSVEVFGVKEPTNCVLFLKGSGGIRLSSAKSASGVGDGGATLR